MVCAYMKIKKKSYQKMVMLYFFVINLIKTWTFKENTTFLLKWINTILNPWRSLYFPLFMSLISVISRQKSRGATCIQFALLFTNFLINLILKITRILALQFTYIHHYVANKFKAETWYITLKSCYYYTLMILHICTRH